MAHSSAARSAPVWPPLIIFTPLSLHHADATRPSQKPHMLASLAGTRHGMVRVVTVAVILWPLGIGLKDACRTLFWRCKAPQGRRFQGFGYLGGPNTIAVLGAFAIPTFQARLCLSASLEGAQWPKTTP